MKVLKSFPTNDPSHTIEVGHPSWDATQTQYSVRARYTNANGGYNNKSPEIPMGDLRPIIEAVASEDILSPKEISAMIEALSRSLTRQLP